MPNRTSSHMNQENSLYYVGLLDSPQLTPPLSGAKIYPSDLVGLNRYANYYAQS